MSLLYIPKEKQTTQLEFNVLGDNKISLEFSSNCGKFGTDEPLAGYILTIDRLLQILNEREDLIDEEFN